MEKVLRVEDGKYVTGEVIGAEVELMKLLWENPSPTSAFAAQTIAMDLSGYDFVEVYCRYSNGTADLIHTKVIVGEKCAFHDAFPSSVATRGTASSERAFTVNTTGVTVSNCIYGYTGQAQTTDNTRVVPVYIYGIKNKVQTIAKDVATTADKCMMSDGVTSVEDEITSINSDLTEKIKWALPSQANLEMFHGSASIALVQGQITSYDVLAQLKSATDWTTVIAVLPNLAASVPAFVNYASGTFYAYSINGSFNNVEISYIAVGF